MPRNPSGIYASTNRTGLDPETIKQLSKARTDFHVLNQTPYIVGQQLSSGKSSTASSSNRSLRKLATEEHVQRAYGAKEHNVHKVHEDLSTDATKQLPSGVEFTRRSNDAAAISGEESQDRSKDSADMSGEESSSEEYTPYSINNFCIPL